MSAKAEYAAVLRLCAGCNRDHLGYASYGGYNEPYYCPGCHAKRTAGFNPQRGDRVRHIDRETGPFSNLVVLARDGDTLTVAPLGFPDRRSNLHVGSVVPG